MRRPVGRPGARRADRVRAREGRSSSRRRRASAGSPTSLAARRTVFDLDLPPVRQGDGAGPVPRGRGAPLLVLALADARRAGPLGGPAVLAVGAQAIHAFVRRGERIDHVAWPTAFLPRGGEHRDMLVDLDADGDPRPLPRGDDERLGHLRLLPRADPRGPPAGRDARGHARRRRPAARPGHDPAQGLPVPPRLRRPRRRRPPGLRRHDDRHRRRQRDARRDEGPGRREDPRLAQPRRQRRLLPPHPRRRGRLRDRRPHPLHVLRLHRREALVHDPRDGRRRRRPPQGPRDPQRAGDAQRLRGHRGGRVGEGAALRAHPARSGRAPTSRATSAT